MSSSCPSSASLPCEPVELHPSSRAARSQRMQVLLAVCLGALCAPLSFTGPAVALTALRDALGGSPTQLNWVTNAFMLSFGASLMVFGALADAYGRRRVFLAGLGVMIASVLCMALLQGPGMLLPLVLLRTVHGLGSAAVLAGGTAALAQAFDGPGRARVFSLVGTSFGVGLAFGPLLSGWLLGWAGWRGVVLSAALVAVAALVLGWRSMQASRNPQAQGLDWPGAVSFSLSLGLLTWAALQAAEQGWGHVPVVLTLLGAVLAMAVFVWIEHHSRQPLLDLSLFRYPRFVGVQLLAAAPAYGYVVLLILLPVRFIGVEGMAPLQAGLLMFALSLPMLCVPLLAGWLVQRLSPALLSSAGLLLSAVGLVWLAQCAPGTPLLQMAAPLLLIGVGMGLPWGLMDGLAVSVVPVAQAGMATGIFSTVRVAGEGIALAVVSAGLAGLLSQRLAQSSVWSAGAAAPMWSEAAQYLVTGNMVQAQRALHGASSADVLPVYGDAFSSLLLVLAGITAATAGLIYVFLRAADAPGD